MALPLEEYQGVRPSELDALAREFPYGIQVAWNHVSYYVLGYAYKHATEFLILSEIDPQQNYQQAMVNRRTAFAWRFREESP
jgi:hypothetical protein